MLQDLCQQRVAGGQPWDGEGFGMESREFPHLPTGKRREIWGTLVRGAPNRANAQKQEARLSAGPLVNKIRSYCEIE